MSGSLERLKTLKKRELKNRNFYLKSIVYVSLFFVFLALLCTAISKDGGTFLSILGGGGFSVACLLFKAIVYENHVIKYSKKIHNIELCLKYGLIPDEME
jgi:hypothetical protein